jgi:SAM-dependent methyltransferase
VPDAALAGHQPELCPLCGAAAQEAYRDDRAKFAASDVSMPLVVDVCLACGFTFLRGARGRAYQEALDAAYTDFRKSAFFPFPHRSAENLRTLETILAHLPDIPHPSVIEIGSNRGDLLYMLKERRPGANVLGVDPARYEQAAAPTLHAFFRRGLFGRCFDAAILQHVLEHVPDTTETAAALADILRPGSLLYVEVPDLENSLEHCVDEFMLEHVNYYTPSSLRRALPGFAAEAVERSSFLRLAARPGSDAPTQPDDPQRILELFARYSRQKTELSEVVATHAATGGRVVFYGVSFYFRQLFRHFQGRLDPTRCAFFDDNFADDVEPTHHLTRITAPEPGDLVLVCSTNFRTQEAMTAPLRNLPGLTLLRPWNSLERT